MVSRVCKTIVLLTTLLACSKSETANGQFERRELGNIWVETKLHIPTENQSGLLHLVVQIGLKDGQDLIKGLSSSAEEEQKWIYYLSYEMEKDLWVETNGKKISPSLFHFERSFDLQSSRRFNLAFEVDESELENFTLVLNPSFSESGIIKIKYD